MFDQKKYINEYNKDNYKSLSFRVRKDKWEAMNSEKQKEIKEKIKKLLKNS